MTHGRGRPHPHPPLFLRTWFILAWVCLTGALQAAGPHPSLPPPVVPYCLGVNIHFTDPKPGEMEMLAATGFKWVRMDFSWHHIERKRGEYDFSACDRLVAALDQHKLRAVFILDYGNPLYADPGDKAHFTSRAHTPEFREAFAKWAVASVSHFKGRGYLWEMWNEPNGSFWNSPDKTGDYIALARATGEALRQAGLLGGKGEAFIGPATSTIDLSYLEACFKAGLLDYWDAVSVHPYRQHAPETVGDEYRRLQRLIGKYAPPGKAIPIISGEWGYSTQYPAFAGMDDAARDEQQARWLAQMFLTNIANGIVLSIWYDWRDDGTNPTNPEHHFGIVRHDYHAGRNPVFDPKPAYFAAQTLASAPVSSLAKLGAFSAFEYSSRAWEPIDGIVPIAGWSTNIRKVIGDGDARVKSRQAVRRPAAGMRSPASGDVLQLTFSMDAGWKFIRCVYNDPIAPLIRAPGRIWPTRAGLWLFGDTQGCAVRIRFVDSTRQCFQADPQQTGTTGWRYLTFPMRSTEEKPLAHWGGANDGVIHYPIKWDSIFLLDNVSRQPVEGEICLSAPSLIY